MAKQYLIDAAKFDNAYRGYNDIFFNALEHAAGVFAEDEIATFVASDSPEEEYDFIGDLPKMREWIGERVVKALRAEKFIIRNKDWEATVKVSRDDVRYDKFNKVKPKIMGLAQAAPRKRDELLTNLLTLGFADSLGVSYDGQYFFDNDHTTAGNGTGQSYSNVATAALDATALDAGLQNGIERVDDFGEPLDISFDTLMYGPKLESTVRDLIKTPTLSGGGKNPHFEIVAPILNRRLRGAYDDYWFLFDTKKPVGALVFQQVGGINFVPREEMRDDNVFWHKDFVFGADGTFNAGYGLPQLAYGSDGTT